MPTATPALPNAAAHPRALRFRPGLWPTVLLLALLPVFLSLADWQWQKAERKSSAQARLDQRHGQAPISLPPTLVADAEALQYRRVAARGHYLAERQILLDNQVRHGVAGVSVLTPLALDGARLTVLVDRGWLPTPADRRQLPHPAVPAGTVDIKGTLVLPPTRFFRLGAETASAGGDAVWQHLDLTRYRELSGLTLQPLVLRLAPEAGHGFLREWPRPDERHDKHRSYALQWLGFAVAAVLIWGWFGLRRQPAPSVRDESCAAVRPLEGGAARPVGKMLRSDRRTVQ
jgi:surfeit locus 1 family protein